MIRLGIIGAGRMARHHADYFTRSPGCRVVAVADPDVARAEGLAARCDARPLRDIGDLLDMVDAVVLASPNTHHRDQAVLAAEAGRHVYCEKPGGLSLADAGNIAEAVHRAGVVATVGYSVRTSPQIRTFRRLHDEGLLGTMRSIGSRRLWNMSPADCPPWYRGLPGGHLLEISVHELDWMIALGGPVTSVYAHAQDRGISDIDSLWLHLRFADGGVGWHEGSWSTTLPMFLRTVEGDRAGAATDEWGAEVYFAEPGADRVSLPLAGELDLRRDFLDCITRGGTPMADVGWNLTVMAVAEAALASIRSGRPEPVQTVPRARTAALWGGDPVIR